MGSAGDDPDRKSDYGLKGDTSSPRFIPRVEVEVEAEAFLAHTAYQLKEIAKLSGADRDHAIDLVAAKSADAELLSLLYNADGASDAKTQLSYTKIAEDINARAKPPLTTYQRSDRYGQPLVGQGLRDAEPPFAAAASSPCSPATKVDPKVSPCWTAGLVGEVPRR